MNAKILVVEDDTDINSLITMNLRDMQHRVESCHNGRVGLERAQNNDYDLIVLDLMLPEVDGLEICQRLRAAEKNSAILMVTARDSETDRILGLEMGADDYLSKPFSIRELQARVKAMLRRMSMLQQAQSSPEENQLHLKDLHIDIARRQVKIRNQHIELTTTEFDLLLHLARSPGLVFSRSQLLDQVWGYAHGGYAHTVNSHINRLRTKLEKNPSEPEYVLTVWGIGYKMNDA